MGMFDSFYDTEGNEWQTKAFACVLDQCEIGEKIGDRQWSSESKYQVKILGGPESDPYQESLATIHDGRLVAVPDERDETLPLLDYGGGWLTSGSREERRKSEQEGK